MYRLTAAEIGVCICLLGDARTSGQDRLKFVSGIKLRLKGCAWRQGAAWRQPETELIQVFREDPWPEPAQIFSARHLSR